MRLYDLCFRELTPSPPGEDPKVDVLLGVVLIERFGG